MMPLPATIESTTLVTAAGAMALAWSRGYLAHKLYYRWEVRVPLQLFASHDCHMTPYHCDLNYQLVEIGNHMWYWPTEWL